MPGTVVLDCSHYQTVDDWRAVADAGVKGVIHKCTEGSDYHDPTYAQRRDDARAAGLLWGAYHFLRPGDMRRQAEYFISMAKSDRFTLLAADHEDEGVSLADLKEFMSEVALRTSNSPALYSGSLIKSQLGTAHDEELSQYRFWLAQYTTGDPSWPTGTWPNWWLWQFSDDGRVDGIEGPVDTNTAWRTQTLTREWSGHMGRPMPPPAPPIHEFPDVIVDVWARPGTRVRVTVNGETINLK